MDITRNDEFAYSMGFKGNDEFPFENPYCVSFYRMFSWCHWLPYIL